MIVDYSTYQSIMLEWLSSRFWPYMVTLTATSHRPSDWFESRLARYRRLWHNRTGDYLEYAASIEKTDRGRNHCHFLFRSPRDFGRHSYDMTTLTANADVIPKDWRKRQATPGQIAYLERDYLRGLPQIEVSPRQGMLANYKPAPPY